ncbi:MAG: hypothetical protein IJO43_00470 [Bacilli bacterium]|nr:hypothetical protein [Bacilli bacterium]
MKIFLVSGASRNGKDTIGNFIQGYCDKNNIKVCRTQISKYLKQYIKDYFGWDGSEETKPRTLLQELGTDIIREKLNKPYFFANRTVEDLEILSHFFDVALVTDIRVPLEIETIKENFDDVVVIKVERVNYEQEMTAEQQKHKIENAMNDYNDYKYILINDTLEKLEEDVMDILKKEGM